MQYGENTLELPEIYHILFTFLSNQDLKHVAQSCRFFGGRYTTENTPRFFPGIATQALQHRQEQALLASATDKMAAIEACTFAIENHRDELLNQLIKQIGPLADQVVSEHRLYEAIDAKNWPAFSTLMEQPQLANFDLMQRNMRGNSPYISVIDSGCAEFFQQLIARFGKPETVLDLDGNTALHLACQSGSLSMVKAVMEHFTVDWHDTNQAGQTPLESITTLEEGETLDEETAHLVEHIKAHICATLTC